MRLLFFATLVTLLTPRLAHADILRLQGDANCPSAIAVTQSLTAVGAGDVVRDEPVAEVAALSDAGAYYQLTLRGVTRAFDDPSRNCAERARIIAVAIALTLHPPAFSPPPPPSRIVRAPRNRKLGRWMIGFAPFGAQVGFGKARPQYTAYQPVTQTVNGVTTTTEERSSYSWDDASVSGYKLALDVSRRLTDRRRMNIWLGVGGTYAHSDRSWRCDAGISSGIEGAFPVSCGDNVSLQLFVLFTFEHAFRAPLVPMIRVGVAGNLLIRDVQTVGTTNPTVFVPTSTGVYGSGGVVVGVALYYFFVPAFSLGIESNLYAGVGTLPYTGPQEIPDPTGRTFLGFDGAWDLRVGTRVTF